MLVFLCSDIEKVTVPSFIKHIGNNAFEEYKQLRTVEIPNDSKLQIIDEYAFLGSLILRNTFN